MLSWFSDKAEIVNSIKSTKCKIKIILKTFNDPYFLEDWIIHHGNFFGFNSLIIADNGSDDDMVKLIYDKYPQIIKFTFSEHHNRIHDSSIFPELYDSLESSCEHRIIIDTDEFLYFYDGVLRSKYEESREVLEIPHGFSTPCVWIENRPGCKDQFYIGNDRTKLVWGGRWGKPIVSSSHKSTKSLIHSEEFPKDIKWFSHSKGAFILFHYNQLSYEQRIKANIRKLERGMVFPEGITLEEILERGSDGIENDTMSRFVEEIIEANKKKFNEGSCLDLADGYFKINSNNELIFYNEHSELEFSEFFKNFNSFLFSDFGVIKS
ncbi:glycosyltransferase family 2 protein [Alishewanella tabrizica]|uniref:Glycosyl transferase family 2 n=1 Tax=Alishewanella tabrizica TaxID=671278 RepID=A0ABQ2WEX9_9ALTE|nr:glycosyltransferase family 2 protein [Alishewanella tabrizica]GGW48455.1 hypothetical protein GCM10008111_00070 [Alishewanella tabrizica]